MDSTPRWIIWVNDKLLMVSVRGIERRESNGGGFRRRRQLGQKGKNGGRKSIWISSGSIYPIANRLSKCQHLLVSSPMNHTWIH